MNLFRFHLQLLNECLSTCLSRAVLVNSYIFLKSASHTYFDLFMIYLWFQKEDAAKPHKGVSVWAFFIFNSPPTEEATHHRGQNLLWGRDGRRLSPQPPCCEANALAMVPARRERCDWECVRMMRLRGCSGIGQLTHIWPVTDQLVTSEA